jgi:hypothetical protein
VATDTALLAQAGGDQPSAFVEQHRAGWSMSVPELRAAQSGRGDSEVIEEALRRELGLAFLEQMWERATLAPDQADTLAVEAQHATRGRRRRR